MDWYMFCYLIFKGMDWYTFCYLLIKWMDWYTFCYLIVLVYDLLFDTHPMTFLRLLNLLFLLPYPYDKHSSDVLPNSCIPWFLCPFLPLFVYFLALCSLLSFSPLIWLLNTKYNYSLFYFLFNTQSKFVFIFVIWLFWYSFCYLIPLSLNRFGIPFVI